MTLEEIKIGSQWKRKDSTPWVALIVGHLPDTDDVVYTSTFGDQFETPAQWNIDRTDFLNYWELISELNSN